MLLWVLWATLANWLKPRMGVWEPLIYSLLVRSTGDNQTCNWHLGRGGILMGLSPWTELNCRTPSCCGRIGWWCKKKTPHIEIGVRIEVVTSWHLVCRWAHEGKRSKSLFGRSPRGQSVTWETMLASLLVLPKNPGTLSEGVGGAGARSPAGSLGANRPQPPSHKAMRSQLSRGTILHWVPNTNTPAPGSSC